jgi:hypothetical protein
MVGAQAGLSHATVRLHPYLSVVQSAYKRTLVVLVEQLAKYNCEYLRLVSSVNATGMKCFNPPEFASWAADTVGNRRIKIEMLVLGSSRRERRLHPRYLLTEAGGLRYERGFAADGQDLECDVSLLWAAMHEKLLNRYTYGQHGFEVAQAYNWPWVKVSRVHNAAASGCAARRWGLPRYQPSRVAKRLCTPANRTMGRIALYRSIAPLESGIQEASIDERFGAARSCL